MSWIKNYVPFQIVLFLSLFKYNLLINIPQKIRQLLWLWQSNLFRIILICVSQGLKECTVFVSGMFHWWRYSNSLEKNIFPVIYLSVDNIYIHIYIFSIAHKPLILKQLIEGHFGFGLERHKTFKGVLRILERTILVFVYINFQGLIKL